MQRSGAASPSRLSDQETLLKRSGLAARGNRAVVRMPDARVPLRFSSLMETHLEAALARLPVALASLSERETPIIDECVGPLPQELRRAPLHDIIYQKPKLPGDRHLPGMMGRPRKPKGLHYLAHMTLEPHGIILDSAVPPADISDHEPYVGCIGETQSVMKSMRLRLTPDTTTPRSIKVLRTSLRMCTAAQQDLCRPLPTGRKT